jgi:arylsulfatase A-like enzyme
MIAPGTKTDAIMCGIDVLPTLCAMAGVPLPAGVELDGRDVAGVLTSGASSPHEEILLFNNEHVVGVRTQRWKYVTHSYYRSMSINMEGAGYPQLYDMARDPSENYSVAGTHPDALAEMQQRISRARDAFHPFKRGVPPFIQQLMQRGLHRVQD